MKPFVNPIENIIDESTEYTKIGWIPKDWELVTLRKISKVVRGGSPRPAGDPKFFNGDFIPWLTVAALTNISESSIFVEETFSYLTKEGAKQSRTLESGTVILANSGATLGVAKVLSFRCCANDGIAAFLNLSNKLYPRYLYYFLNSKTRYYREVVAPGNGQPNLNTELIGITKIPLPPTPRTTKDCPNPQHLGQGHYQNRATHCQKTGTKKRPHAAALDREEAVQGAHRSMEEY
jgi:type I restriction enzyme S subunit